jgi:two-component system sensor histidine kinase/response regulator
MNLRKIDESISRLLDRVLPQDLTTRYLIGLGVVATLSIFGQILIQTSLTQQVHMQDEIRQLENSMPVIDELKRSTLSLQLSSHLQNTQTHSATIRNLTDRIYIEIPPVDLPQDLAVKLYASEKDLARSSTNILALLNRSKENRGRPIRATELGLEADHLITEADDTIRALKNVIAYLENKHRTQVAEFQKVEFLLTLFTLLTLGLEALYIFRPAVRKLYDSLQIRSDFLSRMSHEIRNPMNAIIGMAHLLSETPIDDQQKRYLSILTRSSRGLLDLLNNLLDFSSGESGKIKVENIPFDLHEVIERSLDLAVLSAQANGIELILDLDSDVPFKLMGDPSKIQQVLTNLLGNAIKFTKKGSVILKVTCDLPLPNALISFAVIDTGIGIDAERLPTVFEPFVQEDSSVKRRFGGSGLGLTISRQIVEKMNGDIQVKSEKGMGSEFSFTLNLLVSEPVSIASMLAEHPLGSFSVTFVKRESKVTTVLQKFVEDCGGSVSRSEDQDELLKKLQIEDPRAVIVIDHEFVKSQMPTLLSHLARAASVTHRFIFLIKTTATSEDLAVLGRAGIRNLLFKPVKPRQFLEALETALTGPQSKITRRTSDSETKITPSTLQAKPLKILAVDDSHDNLTLISLYLENTPHKVSFADNGKLAIQKFKEEKFDVVLMDLQMPEVDGYSATTAIRDWERSMHLTPVPIIAISAHDLSHETVRFQASGFTLQLMKPIDATTLLQTLSDTAGTSKILAEDTSARIHSLEKKLATLAPAYLEKRKQELAEIHRYVETRDFKSLQMIGHRLKGNAKTYNFGALADIGAELESAAEREDFAAVRSLVERAEKFILSAAG